MIMKQARSEYLITPEKTRFDNWVGQTSGLRNVTGDNFKTIGVCLLKS